MKDNDSGHQHRTGTTGETIQCKERQVLAMTGRVTEPAIEASMEVTALLMRHDAIWELSLEDGSLDSTEMARLAESWNEIRQAQGHVSREIERADFQIERAAGWLRENGPSARTDAKARNHGMTVVVGAEQAAYAEYDDAASAAD